MLFDILNDISFRLQIKKHAFSFVRFLIILCLYKLKIFLQYF